MLIRDYFAEHRDDAARKLLPVPGHDAKVLIDRGASCGATRSSGAR